MVKIQLHKDNSIRSKLNKINFEYVIEKLMLSEGIDKALVSVIVSDDMQLNALKKKFFSEDVFTDVIAFNYNELDEDINGDIYISFERVKENSLKYSDSTESEFMRVLIHGALHLIGYDDKDHDKKQIMTNKENYYIKLFKEIKLLND